MRDMTYDYLFKFTFDLSRTLTRLMLEELLSIDLSDFEIVNPIHEPQEIDGKEIIVDLIFKDSIGNLYNIEMEDSKLTDEKRERFYYYSNRIFSDQLKEGEKYHLLRSTYTIVFVRGKGRKFIERYKSNDNGYPACEYDSTLIYVFFENIEEIMKSKTLEELSVIENMCYIFHYGFTDDIIRIGRKEVLLMKNASDIFNSEGYQRALKEAYEKRCDLDEANLIEAKREGVEIGKKEERNIINRLNTYLMRDNRLDDLARSLNDQLFQTQLIKEYQLY